VRNNPLTFLDPTGKYLVKCSTTDKKCFNAAEKWEAARQKDLQSKKANVRAAAAAWGDPGKDNGVTITWKSQKDVDKDAGNSSSSQHIGGFVVPGRKADYSPDVQAEFSENLSGADLQQQIGHEGSHVEDALGFLNSYDKQTGKYDAGRNYSRRDTEFKAYEVGSEIKPYSFFQYGPSGYDQLQTFLETNVNYRYNIDDVVFDPLGNWPQ